MFLWCFFEAKTSDKIAFINLDTFSFQAPEFYKKYGYKVIATIEDAPLGSKHFYYKKDLNPE
ncbi:hypothetical protein M2444_005900 [Paenibacillus sp. PastF-3]|nr:hypothetical protein [Paenibacillus sp. PastF-3]